MAHLVVILGAGASRACTPRPGNQDYLPPLTADLFSERYAHTLRNYPLAEAAAADIRVVVSSGALVVERFLRERLRESADPYARRRYLQIPLYLHELLAEVSQHYAPDPDNFDRLINAALALESVLFITLNYDTILDSRLALQTGPITSMDGYVQKEQRWALVKLHGSVNWARAVNDPDLRLPNGDDMMVETDKDYRNAHAVFSRLGQPVEEVLATRDGHLRIRLADGTEIAVPPMDDVEAWEVVGPGEIFVVAPTDDSEPAVWG
jgi:hypothetical protein